MNKSDLVQIIAGKLPTMPVKDVEIVVNTIFDSMTGSLVRGGRIELRGFGSFEVRSRRPRLGRNPKTGAKVDVQTRRVPFFKVGKELKEKVNNNHG